MLASTTLMTDTATVWPRAELTDFGAEFGEPYTIKCNFREGGKLTRDQNGEEFTPSASIRTFDDRPRRGDVIAIGSFLGQSRPVDFPSYTIRKIDNKSNFYGKQPKIILTG